MNEFNKLIDSILEGNAPELHEEGILDRVRARTNQAKTVMSNVSRGIKNTGLGEPQTNTTNAAEKMVVDYLADKFNEINKDLGKLLPKDDRRQEVLNYYNGQFKKVYQSLMNRASDILAPTDKLYKKGTNPPPMPTNGSGGSSSNSSGGRAMSGP